ncbi:putative zinc finger protein 470 protein [Botrytis fragariae]|uniref:Putative zinc finger protein 470 protein n=1 Tax=Botrytis fragariae TaxID=1964551 RepID=A0A8H6AMM7_9HELO|nr:putative zinc finger protein 470 protein [Botrytis fragariae]KAF5870578.1 putative zinc finger protein 470 protein [Botrytis fragariae]
MTPLIWNKEDDIELLAWIDFCKLQKVGTKEDTLDYMIEHSRFTSRDAVKEHLSELWERYGDQSEDSDQTMSLVDIISNGSAYMTKLPGEMRESIRTKVDGNSSDSLMLLIISKMGDHRKQKKATKNSGDPPSREEHERGLKRGKKAERADEDLPPSKKPRSSKDEMPENTDEADIVNGVVKPRLPTQKPATASTEAPVCNGEELTIAKSQALKYNLLAQTANGDSWLKRLKSLENKHKQEIAQMQELWQAESEKLSIMEAEAQGTIRDLRAQLKHLNEARRARQEEEQRALGSGAYVSLEARQFEDLEEIYRLTKENREMHKFSEFADLDLPGSLNIGHETIDDAMDQIQFELSSISCHHINTPQLFPKIFSMPRDLRNLIDSAFNSDIETAIGRNEVEVITKKFGAQVCIRALVLAALRDWVFMSKFPNFAPSNPRILSSYRHIISGLGGESKLSSLDIAAHRAIIEGKWLKEESIPKRATDLAARFSDTVAPLFASTPCNAEYGLFHTWGEHSECWKDRRAHLQEIFQTALTLKADSVVTKSRYGFSIYPPGTTFVRDETDVKGTSRPKSGSSWIHASFHIYDAVIIGNSNQSTLVQTENFVKVSEARTSAKYSKDLLFPKRSPEVVSSRVTEVTETPIPKHKSTDQSKAIVGAEACLIPPVPESNVESLKAQRSAGAGDDAEPDHSEDSPLPRCEECGKEFPAIAQLRRHEKNRKCTECPECGRRFARVTTLQNHQKAEHSEYRAPRPEEFPIEQRRAHPELGTLVSQEKNQCHKKVETAEARDTSPNHQRNKNCTGNQLIKAPRAVSAVASNARPAQACHDNPRQKIPVGEIVNARPKCDLCGNAFSSKESLQRHVRHNTCSLECPECKEKFASLEERRYHQRREHKSVEKKPKDLTIPEPQSPSTPLKESDKSQISNQTRTPSSNNIQRHDIDGQPRYKKTPRRETEDSDADDMLSPSETVKTKRAQRRRSTRSSDRRAEVRIIDSQEALVRSRGKRSKTPAIDE